MNKFQRLIRKINVHGGQVPQRQHQPGYKMAPKLARIEPPQPAHTPNTIKWTRPGRKERPYFNANNDPLMLHGGPKVLKSRVEATEIAVERMAGVKR